MARTQRSSLVRRARTSDSFAIVSHVSSQSMQILKLLCSPEIGFGFQASHTNGAAAFLVPCGASRRVETFLKNKMFPSYLARRHKDIRARFGSDYNIRTVYMIEGTTHTTSWCRGLARRHGREVRGFVSVSPTMGMPDFRVGGSAGEVIDHPVCITESWPSGTLTRTFVSDMVPVDHRIRPYVSTAGRKAALDLCKADGEALQTTQFPQA